jgi:hypothetical protein
VSRDIVQRQRTELTLEWNIHEGTNVAMKDTTRTIISHSNVRNYLLQYSFPLGEFLVFRLGHLEFLAELLHAW